MSLPTINVPQYELVLPSTKEKVMYRPFLVKEEKILLLALEDGADKALNPRQLRSVSLISFILFIFLFIPIHSVEIADYSGNTFQEFQDEIVCGVERCQMKVSIAELWACDYEGQNTDVFCTSDAKNSGATIGILSISISLLLMACCLKFFSEPEKNDTDSEQGLDKS